MYLDIIYTTKEWILTHSSHVTKLFYNESNKKVEIMLMCKTCDCAKKIDEVMKTETNGEQYAC